MTGKTNSSSRHTVQVIVTILLCIAIAQLYMFVADVLYKNTANKHWQGKRYKARKNNPWNIAAADSCAALLQTGDLVVRRGDDMTSYMLSQLNSTDKTYSHCGLVVIEDGKPYVYHSIGGEDNPDQVMKREPARVWLSPANNLAIAAYRYDMPDSVNSELVNTLYEYYGQGTKFDMDFDMGTDDRMYCSEMIYKVVRTATGNNRYIQTRSSYGKSFVGVDDLYLNSHTTRICQVRFK